jgi:hypothetical protein
MHDEGRGGCFGDTGPGSRVVLWNAPGYGEGGWCCFVVDGAVESLASKTVAVGEV